MEHRKFQRIEMDQLDADVSDGVGFYPGRVSDISRFGMCMTDLPKRLDDKIKKMTVVVSGLGKNFKMLVKPRWSTKTGLRKMVGFEIVNTPWGWTEFVMQFETNADDSWGAVNL